MACKVAKNKRWISCERTSTCSERVTARGLNASTGFPRRAMQQERFGISGAVLGYCQALFNRVGAPAEHTSRVLSLLSEAGLLVGAKSRIVLGLSPTRNGG